MTLKAFSQIVRKRTNEWRAILISVPSVTGLLLILRLLGWLQPLELAAFDHFMRLRPISPPDPRIVIVGMDEQDITLLGWPLSDEKMADLIIRLKQHQPRLIGLDIYRDLPVQPGHQKLLKVFETTPNLIGITKVIDDGSGSIVAPPAVLAERNQVAANDVPVDPDGKIRRGFLFPLTSQEDSVPSLALLLALLYLQDEQITPNLETTNLTLNQTEFIPFEANDGGYVGAEAKGYQILLNLRGPVRHFQVIPIRDVLADRVPNGLLRDRIVLIGPTATSLNDFFYTAFNDSRKTVPMPGVEIQANLTSQIINAVKEGRALIQVWSEPVEVLWITIWVIAGTIVSWGLRSSRFAIPTILVTIAGLGFGSYLAFLQGWWVPVVPPVMGFTAAAIAITGYTAMIEREERKLVMNLFGRHVTSQVADAIWHQRDQILASGRMPGRTLTATVLFTDLRDFSSIAEKTDPETLMSWLNEYMEAMAQLVLEHGGIIDKFIGDSVMAVFGVPIPHVSIEEIAEDARQSVRCALAMADKLVILNQRWANHNQPTVAMRVGIATGRVVTGSLGSSQRLDYTTLGDTVNIASRLEGYSKTRDSGLCRILISEETQQLSQEQFISEFVGGILLKGREHPVNVYQVLGYRS